MDVERVVLFPARLEMLSNLVKKFQICGKSYPSLLWYGLLGKMVATIPMVEHARLHMRPLQWHLNTQLKGNLDCQGFWDLNVPVMLTMQLLPTFQWWIWLSR